MSTDTQLPVETTADFKGPQGEASRWLSEIDLFESEAKEVFIRYEKIVKRYRNESWRDDIPAATGADARGRGFAMFWANVETLKPTIYAQPPKADVQRRWKDKDPVARCASEILERCLDYFIDQQAFQDSVIACRDDYLIVGQGVQWHRYVPHFHDVTLKVPVRKAGKGVPDQGVQITNDADAYSPDESEAYEAPDSDGNYGPIGEDEEVLEGESGPYVERTQREIQSEEWVPDYIYWRDFGWTPGARNWSEVYCVWRKCYMTRDELISRFGKDVGSKVRLDHSPSKAANEAGDRDAGSKQFYKKATIYEIWDSTTRKTHWLARSYDGDLLDSRPYPIRLSGRFPCQKPVFATQTNGSVSPVADYLQYQDQAQEMDRLTQRIYVLMDAIQAKYLYAGNIPELQNLLQNAGELDGTPVDVSLLAMFNGDITKAIYFFPIEKMVEALNELLAARERVKQDAYEITGIADIIRGSSDPNETLGAQQLKAQSSSIRVKDRQKNFADFVRGALRIGSDIITNHFQPDSIAQICDMKTVPESNWIKGPNGQWMDPAQVQALMQAQQQAMMQGPAGNAAPPPMPPGPQGQGLGPAGAPMLPGVPQGIPMMGHNGGPPMPPETLGQAAIKLLKDPLMRNFRIDIETDSTVAMDEATEKSARLEFVTAIGQFLEAAQQITAGPMGAELGPLLGEILLFAVRGFKVGTQLEGAIESAIEQMQTKAKNPTPPPPDPAMVKAQAEAKLLEQEGQQNAQAHQMEMQRTQAEAQADQISRQGEMAAEAQRAQADQAVAQADIIKAGIGVKTAQIGLQTAAIRAREAARPKPNGAGK